MRLFLRLSYQKKRTLVHSSLTITCCVFLYLLLKHRHSFLSPSTFSQPSEFLLNGQHKQTQHYPVPGAYIETYTPSNVSYCNFKYNLPNELSYLDSDLLFSPQLGKRGTYRVLYNVIEGQLNDSITSPSVTYCTHLTPHFVYHIAEIVKYWESAISVAAYVPDVDADVTIQQLKHLCHCLPGMSRLSVHFVFPDNRRPYVQRSTTRTKCLVPDMSDLETYRNRENLPYPVNVGRNVARNAAQTSHVLVADVELIPSEHLASSFVRMLRSYRLANIPSNHVFVVPVFEVESGESVPRKKKELKKLYDDEKAVYFHRWVCQHCQKFPGLVKWLNKPNRGDAMIKPFIVARREDPFHRWEPIYIGTNKEPFYSETLSWEGQQDKMTQMVEMCLMGYKFIILDEAFLVHWPGTKRRTSDSKVRNAWRKPHQRQNSKQYDVIIDYLASKYTENEKCKL